jgi:hypothetical protein
LIEILEARTELLSALTEAERVFVEHLLRVAPEFRYEPSGRREIRPPPAPGLESAVTVAKMMSGSAKAVDLNRGRPAGRNAR